MLNILFKAFRLVTFKSPFQLVLIITAFLSQAELFHFHKSDNSSHPFCASPEFRVLWIFLSKHLVDWEDYFFLFKPQVIYSWKNTGKKSSSSKGRPPIHKVVIDIIRQIKIDNPSFSAERLFKQLTSLNISNVPAINTIAKYIKASFPSFFESALHSWTNTLDALGAGLFSIDFMTVKINSFSKAYVFVLINRKSRKVAHCAVSWAAPSAAWVQNQLSKVLLSGVQIKHLLSDNASCFSSHGFKMFAADNNISQIFTTPGAPYENGVTERFNGILRSELLSHLVFTDASQLESFLLSYINDYFNIHRAHHSLGNSTPIPSPVLPPTKLEDTVFKKTPILNGLYTIYEKQAA